VRKRRSVGICKGINLTSVHDVHSLGLLFFSLVLEAVGSPSGRISRLEARMRAPTSASRLNAVRGRGPVQRGQRAPVLLHCIVWVFHRSEAMRLRPETLVRWHRRGFRRYWRWKSRTWEARPQSMRGYCAAPRMSSETMLWGAPPRPSVRSCFHRRLNPRFCDIPHPLAANTLVTSRRLTAGGRIEGFKPSHQRAGSIG